MLTLWLRDPPTVYLRHTKIHQGSNSDTYIIDNKSLMPSLTAAFLHFINHSPPVTRDKCKAIHYRPWQAMRVPGCWGFQILRQSALEGGKVVNPTHRPPLPPGNIPGTNFCYRLSRPQGHSATGRIMSMKKSSDTIGNRTSDLRVCSAVPQPLRHQQRAPVTRDMRFNSRHHMRTSLSSLFNICLFYFPRNKTAGERRLPPTSKQQPRLRMCGAMPLLPLSSTWTTSPLPDIILCWKVTPKHIN
jgi:hypothetical protein